MKYYLEIIEEKELKAKLRRKKIIVKDGKPEEKEEGPGKQIVYKTIKTGTYRSPQTKLIRKRTITKYGRDKEIKEDIPGVEIIDKKLKYGKGAWS